MTAADPDRWWQAEAENNLRRALAAEAEVARLRVALEQQVVEAQDTAAAVAREDAVRDALAAVTGTSLRDAVPRHPHGPPYDPRWFIACERAVEVARAACAAAVAGLRPR